MQSYIREREVKTLVGKSGERKVGKERKKGRGGGFEARLNLNLRGLSQLFLSHWCQRKKLRVLLMSG